MWDYKILDHIPISGKYEELIFGGSDGTFTRVRFFEDMHDWVGVFQNGIRNRIKVHVVDNKSIILSAGIIYIIDLNIRKAISISDNNDFYDLIADSEQIFCADSDSIVIFKGSLLVKRIELYYFSDFLFLGMDLNKVYCKGYQSWDGWFEFALDRDKLEIV